MTVIEMMVVVGLLGVILPTMYTTVDAFQHETSLSADRVSAEADAQIALDRLAKELRAAAPVAENGATTAVTFTAATSQSMTFYSALGGNGPSKISVSLASGGKVGVDNLVETVLAADAGNTAPNETYSSAARTIIDSSYVVPASTSFSYFAVGSSTPLSFPIDSAHLATIESVSITLTSRLSSRSPAVTLTTTIPLENVDIANAPSTTTS